MCGADAAIRSQPVTLQVKAVHLTCVAGLCHPSCLQREKLSKRTLNFVPGRQFYRHIQNHPEVREEPQDYYFEDFNMEERLNPTQ